MKKTISALLMVSILGYVIGNLVVATSSGSAPAGCWRMYKHDVDDKEWNNGEWYWAGVRGYVRICDGKATIETNTVEHVAAVSINKGTHIIMGPYTDQTPVIAYTRFEYQRVNGETGWANAVIYATPAPTPVNTGENP
ncbi:hypothetical protein A3L12_08080 [Thermococcus sp. P6]|uniref:hypothetical protein n=1 Tax=Thermococcus sp. P6 TaxID=122420 RepID=UPI000B59D8F4|nr:hypothetical protein [Thermococcus sp. P6]ASJ11254.1 hypothetical protein A3L12_08080 [Thermococcus sp. P6]